MAESLKDGEFWLPPKFLADDDAAVLVDKKTNNNISTDWLGFDSSEASTDLLPFEFPYGFETFVGVPSDLSSPVESVIGSSETESDEEEYLADLTRQMAHSTLGNGFSSENSKVRVVSGSPQSTLCGCSKNSSRGSPNGEFESSSPVKTWDLLHAAAEVARMRMNEKGYMFNQNSRGVLGPPRKQSPVAVPVNNSNTDVGFYQQLQATHFEQLRQQQMMKQHNSAVWGGRYQHQQNQQTVQNRGNRESYGRSNCGPWGFSASTRPTPLQQTVSPPNRSGMRAMFLGNPCGKRESAGTGVFLPRQVGTPSETRKKPACSTALVPARVMQALNLNLDDLVVQPQLQSHVSQRSDSDQYASLRLRNNNNAHSHQIKRNLRSPQLAAAINHELRLPQEWTY